MKKILIFLIIFVTIFFGAYKCKKIILKNLYVIKYEDIVKEYSKKYQIDEYLIYATIKAESNFDEKAISNKGAKGLMQIIDSTAEEIAEKLGMSLNEGDILKPEININFGTKYLSDLIVKYNCIELALAAYNAGSGKVDSWINEKKLKSDGSDIQNIPYSETKNYVRKILMNYETYKKLYQEEV